MIAIRSRTRVTIAVMSLELIKRTDHNDVSSELESLLNQIRQLTVLQKPVCLPFARPLAELSTDDSISCRQPFSRLTLRHVLGVQLTEPAADCYVLHEGSYLGTMSSTV